MRIFTIRIDSIYFSLNLKALKECNSVKCLQIWANYLTSEFDTNDLCDVISLRKDISAIEISAQLWISQFKKIMKTIYDHPNIKKIVIKDTCSFNYDICEFINNRIEDMDILLYTEISAINEEHISNIMKICNFNKINNRVPIYMMMLRKRANCVVHLLPRRVLIYLLGFIGSRWI